MREKGSKSEARLAEESVLSTEHPQDIVMLDVSAAFDTVNHKILTERLEHRLEVRESALDWFKSYLNERKQFVSIGKTVSDDQYLTCNVPQGSVLGPALFGDYSAPVCDIFRRYNIGYHTYADDTQVYLSFKPNVSEEESIKRLESCLSEVRDWMASNDLKLNDDKTEFAIIGPTHYIQQVHETAITIGNCEITKTAKVKNIGAILDSSLTMIPQVNATSKAGWFNLYQISKLKHFLSFDQIKIAVHSFVTSKLDQNNSLLIGLPQTTLLKLRRVQHAAARLLLQAKKSDHITPLLIKLHWLPIEQRIKFKVLLLTYKSLNNQGPQYMQDMLIPYTPSRTLRSSAESLLHQPKSRTTYGDHAYSVAAPRLWNSIPCDIKNCASTFAFKSALKTLLFKEAFAA